MHTGYRFCFTIAAFYKLKQECELHVAEAAEVQKYKVQIFYKYDSYWFSIHGLIHSNYTQARQKKSFTVSIQQSVRMFSCS